MIIPAMTPMMMPVEPLVATADAPVDKGEGGGDGGEGGGGGGEGGGGGDGGEGGGGGAGQVETVPERPFLFTVGQEQTVAPPPTKTFDPWVWEIGNVR